MGLFNWIGIGNDESDANDSKRMQEKNKKIIAEQSHLLEGFKKLNKDLGRDSATRSARMRNADRLIKEGSGR